MALSLGRTLYNLSGRALQVGATTRPPRPDGQLVWLHAPDPDYAGGMAQLALRLLRDSKAAVVLTCPEPLPISHRRLIQQPPPADTALDAKAFLKHWAPDLAILSDGELRPALLFEARARRLPLLMVEARSPYLPKGRGGWYPGLMRECLGFFHEIMALDEPAARMFRKSGAPSVTLSGRMEQASSALPYQEPERASLALQMATRPVWLATAVPASEEAAVIAAHRSALRLAHRLLLILVPADPNRAADLAAQIEQQEGWSVALRSNEQEPEAEIAVYIPDSAAEYGLWYRLAPVCFIGGSLSGDGAARTPLEPAALGSAIIHGPKPGPYAAEFDRLAAARAARAVITPADLAEALSDLLAPDRAARLAQAAWGLASEGVEVTDHILDLSRHLLEKAA